LKKIFRKESKNILNIRMIVMKIYRLLAAIIFILVSSLYAQNSSGNARLIVLFTHDMHSNFLPGKFRLENGGIEEKGGYARLAEAIRIEREAAGADKTLVLDAGDISMGSLYHTIISKEACELRIMGEMGYDATTIGNHEFDFKPAGLAGMLKAAKQKGRRLPSILSSNVIIGKENNLKDLRSAWKDYPVKNNMIVNRGGLKVGIFGIIGLDAIDDSPNAKPAGFSDPTGAAKREVKALKKAGADIIICLSHCGTMTGSSHSPDEELAKDVKGIDIIISGHSHTLLEKPIISGKTIIVSSGYYAKNLGRLEVSFSGGKAMVEKYGIIPITEKIKASPEISAMIDSFNDDIDREYLSKFGMKVRDVVAESRFDFTSLVDAYREPGEMGLGDLITDAYRAAVDNAEKGSQPRPDMIFQPIGTIRSSFLSGKISTSDVFNVLSLGIGEDGVPGYPLASFYVNGSELKNILEVEASISLIKNDAHLQIGGVRFTYNPNRILFDRVMKVWVIDENGKDIQLDAKKLYRVCTNYYSALMINAISGLTFNLLTIVPKDRNGNPLKNISDCIIDGNPSMHGSQEIKEWVALAKYMKSFKDTDGNGIPDIPENYKKSAGRYYAESSLNPLKIFGNGNFITKIFLGLIIVFISLIFYFFYRIFKKYKGKQQANM
jgi:2',3'-cyclic-nucleotide 2'-phosphodiesterase (5'-nucleotidase family)